MAVTTHTTTLNFTSTAKLVVTWTEDDQPTYRKLKITKMVFTSSKSGGLGQRWKLDCFFNGWSGEESSYQAGGSWTLAKGTTSRTMEPANTHIQWTKTKATRSVGVVELEAGIYKPDGIVEYSYIDTYRISSSYQISAKTHYNVVINFNGSGAANQTLTKWYNETLTLPAAPSRTNYAFNRFNTNTSNTGTVYAAKASYTANAAATLYAIWNPRLSFDANGGSGAPGAQTKTFGQALTLSTVRPARVGYTFMGWGTSSSATSASYQAGGTYPAGSNAAATLYAVWAPTPPTITGRAYRTTRGSGDAGSKRIADKSAYPEADTGTSAVVELTVSSASDNGAIKSVRLTEPESSLDASFALNPEPTSATLCFVLGDTGTYSTDVTYRFTAAVTYSVDGTTVTTPATAYVNLAKAYFLVDWKAGGTGMAVGGPATMDGFVVYMEPFIVQAFAGIIQMIAGVDPPEGWLPCDGRAVSRTDYAILFSRIGTTWGAGDGSTTFNLPDLRGRGPIGEGAGSGLTSRTLGGTGGSEHIQSHTHGFTNPKIPNHVHTMAHTHPTGSGKNRLIGYLYDANGSGGVSTGVTKVRVTAASSGTNYVPRVANADVDFSGVANTGSSSAANTGNPTSLDATTGGAVGAVSGTTTGSSGNMQPFAVVKFIICTGKTS